MQASKEVLSSYPTPTVKRRLISMVYELLLGLAVLFLPLLVFELASRGSLKPMAWHLRQALVFIVLGIYFVHQWSRNGQTLAMQTWRIRVVMTDGGPLSARTAAFRYLLSWMWLVPAVALSYTLKLPHLHELYAIFGGILLWSLTAFFTPGRQFLHDKMAGTRLVQLPKPVKTVASPVQS